jgi:hypothetical protein
MRNIRLGLSFLVAAALFITLLAVASLNFPKLLGKERLWNLNTGMYSDRVYICGIKISERIVKSGLEPIFNRQNRTGQTGFPQVVIYSTSIFQPPRGGQWMRIAHLTGRFAEVSAGSAGIEPERLLSLIHAQDDTEMLRLFYERGQNSSVRDGIYTYTLDSSGKSPTNITVKDADGLDWRLKNLHLRLSPYDGFRVQEVHAFSLPPHENAS